MPAKSERDEQIFIRRFVSAYENFTWAGSKIDALDEVEDGAVDALVTRADGRTMAIEHTLIQPFVGDKSDCAMFEKAFLRIKNYKSLAVPGANISVYVPAGILNGIRKPKKQADVVNSIHSWIAENRLHLREGEHKYSCDIPGRLPVTLTVKRHVSGRPHPNPGTILVGRQQVKNDLNEVIEQALRDKLRKLVNTKADRHLLLLERDQFNFFPDLIFAEIERQRANFPLLESVHEIWHVETIGYRQGGYVDFELWKDGKVLARMAFQNERLYAHYRDGMPCPM